MSRLLARVRAILQGEPLRVVVYGAAVVYFIVAGISDRIPDVTLDEATVLATTALAALTELLRQLVVPVTVVENLIADIIDDK